MWHYVWGLINGAALAALLIGTARAEPIQVPVTDLDGIAVIDVPPGAPGKSAYQTWLDLGNTGDEQAFIDSLKGADSTAEGPAGPANALSVGTVETVPFGEPATATITGDAPSQVLNLGLPQGPQGQPGSGGGSTGGWTGLTTLSCPGAITSGTHVFDRVKMTGTGTNTCLTVSGTAIVTVRNSDIGNVGIVALANGTGILTVENSNIHDFETAGLRCNTTTGDCAFKNNLVHKSVTGCVTYDPDPTGCNGPRGNGISLTNGHGTRVTGNRIWDVEFACLRALGDADESIVVGNYCEGSLYDAAFYFEFSWHRSVVALNILDGKGRSSKGMTFTNCFGPNSADGHQADVYGNLVQGFRGAWAMYGQCEVNFHHNTVNCDEPYDNPATAANEETTISRGYIGIMLNAGTGGRANVARDNVIKHCSIGIAIGQGATAAGDPAWVEGNSMLDVPTPITGAIFNFPAFAAKTAHRPLIPGTHVIQNNRRADTLAIVNPQ